MKTLIADDDITSRLILEESLRKIGFKTVSAVDGSSAWEILKKPAPPRLLLLDWNMPDISGIDICQRLRESETDNPPYIIIFTARDAKTDIAHGLNAGANDYITKPCDQLELRARLRVAARMLELQDKLLATRNTLAHQAMHDMLTGIFNRRAILDLLERELSRICREKQALNIGMYDIDNFKHVNDVYGHQIGDEILIGVVKRIETYTRAYTAIGRYGGEEFLSLITGPSGVLTDAVHERLRDAVAAQPFKTIAGDIPVTISIGVAWSRFDSTSDSLIGAADKALYAAKQSGRNCVVKAEQ